LIISGVIEEVSRICESKELMRMEKLTFEQLPIVVAEIRALLQRMEQKLNTLTRPEEQDALLTIEEAARLINLKVSTIYAKVSKRQIPVVKKDKKLYFEKTALLKWLMEGKKMTSAEIADLAERFPKGKTGKR